MRKGNTKLTKAVLAVIDFESLCADTKMARKSLLGLVRATGRIFKLSSIAS